MVEIKCAHTDVLPIAELKAKFHPKNPNVHPDDQLERLSAILKYQGIRKPATISKRSGLITAGHGRIVAAERAGADKFPVDYQDYESDEQEYADLTADNAIASWAALDLSGINQHVPELGPDFDLDMLGIKDFTLDAAEKLDPGCDEDEVPEQADTRVKRGDVWRLGAHRLMCGDSTAITDVEKLMNGAKADMVFTDPPYGVNYEGGHFHSGDVNIKRKREKLANDDSAEIYKDLCPVVAAYCDGPVYMWFADCKGETIFSAVSAVSAVGEIHAMIIWHKTNATYAAMNAQYKVRHEPCLYWKPKGKTLKWAGPSNECTLWEMKKESSNKLHPTQKPVELAERAIGNHDAQNVIDLFGGSGSTLIACEKTNRRCFMMEIDPHYCDVILARWEKYTGKTAERVEEGETDGH